jgi:Effector-associated domain 1
MPGSQSWDKRLTDLNALLAELYSTVDDSRRVVVSAGISTSLIKFHDAAAVNWFNILDEARKRGRVDEIVRVAMADFPDNASLMRLARQDFQDPEQDNNLTKEPKPNAQAKTAPEPSSKDEPPQQASSSTLNTTVVSPPPSESAAHVVILIHGIRDFGLWQSTIRHTLEEEGLKAEAINYGRFNLIEFLLPFPHFRRKAIETVWNQIRIVNQNNKGALLSIIAHSFGTYVVSHLIRNTFDIDFYRVIFCGSVVPYNFPFEQFQNRFLAPILNEVGTRDIWPAMAESITTGYGSAGTYGFRRPLIRDRWHNGASHGYFLNEGFCKRFWCPFLRDGTVVPGSEEPESPRLWIRLLSVIKLKFLIAAGVFFLVFTLAYSYFAPQNTDASILEQYLRHNGATIDSARAAQLQSCLVQQGVNASITAFLYGESFAAQRAVCMRSLGLR